MTIFEYLDTLDNDPINPGTSLKYFEDRATNADIKSANRKPYVVVEHLDENAREALYDHEVLVDQVVDVAIYQEPALDGTTPTKTTMVAVWHKVMDAVHNVTEHTFKRSFINLEYVTGVEPRYDEATKGLFASVRFRIHFARG